MLSAQVHVHHTYASYRQSQYVATFHVDPTELDGSNCCWEKGLPTQSTAHRLTHLWVLPKFLSHDNHWSSRLKPIICWRIGYISLLGPYLQHVISIFDTSSRVLIHRSLTDTDTGYNLGGVSFPHQFPHTSQPIVLRFPLRASPSIRSMILNLKLQ
jgi:hypothetical protein